LRAAKLADFFAPYLRHGRAGTMGSVADGVAIVLALPIAIWTALRLARRRLWTWTSGLMAIIVVPLYVLPFFLINAEPRYRWPVDVILILESIALIAPRRAHAQAKA